MSNDLGSVPMRLGLIALLLVVHGFFVMMNTAIGSAGQNKEKYQSANKLVTLLTGCFGAWLAFTGWLEVLLYFISIISLAQYFPRKIGLQHDEKIAEKLPYLLFCGRSLGC